MGRTHPPSHISFNGLAVTTHSPAPSSPLGDRNGEASTLLAEGASSPLGDRNGEASTLLAKGALANLYKIRQRIPATA